jgi:hypothetical protein
VLNQVRGSRQFSTGWARYTTLLIRRKATTTFPDRGGPSPFPVGKSSSRLSPGAVSNRPARGKHVDVQSRRRLNFVFNPLHDDRHCRYVCCRTSHVLRRIIRAHYAQESHVHYAPAILYVRARQRQRSKRGRAQILISARLYVSCERLFWSGLSTK